MFLRCSPTSSHSDLTMKLRVHQESSGFWNVIYEKIKLVTVSQEDNFDLITAQIERTINGVATSIKNTLQQVSEVIRVVFLFDQARYLKIKKKDESSESKDDNFNMLIRGMRVLPSGSVLRTFCIQTDTASSVASLALTKELDNSERARSSGLKLYPPFVWVMTLDAWWRKALTVSFGNITSKDEILMELKACLINNLEQTTSSSSSSSS
jgi:hypothetical protein